MQPYAYTDPQNHKLTIYRTADHDVRPYIAVTADNLAIGGEHVSVWIPLDDARRLTDAIADGCTYEHADHMGDRLAVKYADDWTTFALTRAPRDDDEEPATVPVVVLSARLPELHSALTAAVEDAHPADGEKPHPHPDDEERADETRLALLDGRDALAFVVIRPADGPDNVTVEAGSRGMSKAAAAYVLRAVADEFDDAARAEDDEPIPYTLTEQAETQAAPAGSAAIRRKLRRWAYAAGHIESELDGAVDRMYALIAQDATRGPAAEQPAAEAQR